jgi:hypothetical protein
LGQPTAAPRALRACILCFAARGSFKPSGLTSRLAKVVGAPEDELCGKSDRRVCVLSEYASSLSRENCYGTASRA